MLRFKGNSGFYAVAVLKIPLQYFLYILQFSNENCPVGHNMLGETIKRLCKDAGIEGQITNNSPHQFAYSSALYVHARTVKQKLRTERETGV